MANYQIDFFKDVGFTADYSNILDFPSVQARDEYFDALESISVTGTSTFNDFTNGGTVRVVADMWYDKVAYARIKSVKFSDGVPYTTNVYCFVTNYNVISSNENVTVVEYILTNDIWTNFQFDVSLKPCSVDRMHVNRWEKYNGKTVMSDDVVKPSSDGVYANMISEKYTKYSQYMNVWCCHYDSDTDTFDDVQFVKKNVRVVWILVVATHTYGELDDQMQFHIFPVKISDLEYNCSNDSNITYFTQNAICSGYLYGALDDKPQSEPYTQSNVFNNNYTPIIAEKLRNFVFPSIDCLDSAQLLKSLKLTEADVVTIINIMPIRHIHTDITYDDERHGNYFGTFGKMRWQCGMKLTTQISTIYTHSIYQLNDVRRGTPITLSKFLQVTPPTDGALHSDKYEPMMSRAPVRRYYMCDGDNSAFVEIPDVLVAKDNEVEFVTDVDINPTQCSDIVYDSNRVSSNAKGFMFVCPSLQVDFMNDAWYSYCVTQRDSDRAMAVANVFAGGVADTGSTYVSAGIGNRSNMTQAKARDLELQTERTMSRYAQTDRDKAYSQAKILELQGKRGLATDMAGLATKASLVGGVTAIAGQAIASGVSQWAKETTMKNTPATLASAGNFSSKIIGDWFALGIVEVRADDRAYKQYDEIYSKYGYAIGCVTTPNFRTRKYFNYLKTNGAIVTGKASQSVLITIASIFDNGVTIWHMDHNTAETLYKYEYENIERGII